MKKLRVFDFDDTLARTDSRVRVRKSSGDQLELTPAQYATYDKDLEDTLDYSDFNTLIRPRIIPWVFKILQNVVSSGGDAIVLTARGPESQGLIRDFLAVHGISGIEIVTLGDSNPMMKAAHIAARIEEFGYNFVEFFDDSVKNVHAVERMVANRYPDVTVRARHVVHKSDSQHRVTEARLRQIIRNSLL